MLSQTVQWNKIECDKMTSQNCSPFFLHPIFQMYLVLSEIQNCFLTSGLYCSSFQCISRLSVQKESESNKWKEVNKTLKYIFQAVCVAVGVFLTSCIVRALMHATFWVLFCPCKIGVKTVLHFSVHQTDKVCLNPECPEFSVLGCELPSFKINTSLHCHFFY